MHRSSGCSSFSTNLVSSVTPSSRAGIVAGQTRRAEVAGYILANVLFSNRPVRVKRFQTIHDCGVDIARGLALLFGIGTKALPS